MHEPEVTSTGLLKNVGVVITVELRVAARSQETLTQYITFVGRGSSLARLSRLEERQTCRGGRDGEISFTRLPITADPFSTVRAMGNQNW